MGENKFNNNDVDLISGLPDVIIHMIMSFLAMDELTQLSTVSKRFLSATKPSPPLLVLDYNAFTKRFPAAQDFDFEVFTKKPEEEPNFDFDAYPEKSEEEEKEDSVKRESFLNFVEASVEQRRLLMMNNSNNDFGCMQRLSFMGPISPHYASDTRIDEMVNFALENKFIELNLDGNINIHILSCLERDVTCRLSASAIFSAQHIRILKLRGFKLEGDGDHDVEHLTSHCSKFKTINLSGANLKRVALDAILGLEMVNVDPQVSLESFSLAIKRHPAAVRSPIQYETVPDKQRFREINLHSFKSLKYLELKNTNIITDEWFGDRVSQFDLLETLKLDMCLNLTKILYEQQ